MLYNHKAFVVFGDQTSALWSNLVWNSRGDSNWLLCCLL